MATLKHACIVLLAVLFCSPSLMAQRRRFKVEEEVQFQHLGGWKPAVVIQVEGKRVAIEYEFAGRSHRKVLAATELRYPWEERAITPMRSWSDQEKKFKVRAAGVAMTQTTITLLKQDDGQEVTVPIEKLSDTDKAYLKKRISALGPSIAQLPEQASFTTQSSIGQQIAWNNASDLSEIAPDGLPSYASIPMAGVAFPRADFFENLVFLDPIGGSAGWLAVGTLGREKPSRIMWASLAEGKIKRMHLVPEGERLVAVHAPSRQMLTLEKDSSRLTLWETDPKVVVPTGKKSWISKADGSSGSGWDIWAEIVASNRVIHRWGRNQYVVWDTDAENEAFRLEQESFFHADLALSPGQKYIVLPEDKRVRILDSSSGTTLASLPVEGGSAAGVGISQDGQKLAVLTRSQLAVWQFGSNEQPKRYRADSVGTPFTATVEWIDDNSLLIDRKTLFDLRYELPVWSYEPKVFEVKRDSFGSRTQTVFGDKLCYAVEFRGSNSGFVVGAVDLPGPMVREALEDLDPESLFILRRGARVNIRTECGEFDNQVRRSLEKQIEDNGWVYDASSTTMLYAKMGRGDAQTVTYRLSGGGSGTETVTAQPYFSKLELLYGGEIAWSSTGGSGGLPSVVFVTDGGSIQSEINKNAHANPEHYERTDIPEDIYDPNKKNGIGVSTISAQGLTPTLK